MFTPLRSRSTITFADAKASSCAVERQRDSLAAARAGGVGLNQEHMATLMQSPISPSFAWRDVQLTHRGRRHVG
jgi:hypothetical protein